MKRTWGSGTAFPSTWPVDAWFLRTDLKKLFKNTGTLEAPSFLAELTDGEPFAGEIIALT